MQKMYWGSTPTPANFWVRNMPIDTFGDSLSRQFFLSWKMDTLSDASGGEIHRFKTALRSWHMVADTGAPNNLLPTTPSNGTLGFLQIHQTGNAAASNQHVKGPVTYSIPESSATRVMVRLNGRKLQNTTASCSLVTQWTIYPTGQVFRYDSIYGNAAQVDSIQFRFYQKDDVASSGLASKIKGRGAIAGGVMIHDWALAHLSMRDNAGPVPAPFSSPGDTVRMQQMTSLYRGLVFSEKTPWPAANKPYQMAFYMDIQREHMNQLLADSIANGVQYIEPLGMITGTQITTSPGDADGNGFNEREGAYIISASGNTAHFTLPAHGDTCRFYPAFRITNYTAGVLPVCVAVDSVELVAGLDYNAHVNVAENELVIQLGMVARNSTNIYVSATSPLEDYTTWPQHQDFVLNTKTLGMGSNVLDFPVLVRLTNGTFSGFSSTLNGGADIRFARPDGRHLFYGIERWVDSAGHNDTADIWVRVDTVRANDSLQYIRMYYGKSGATNRSNGKGVFNELNGFAGVYHFGAGLDSMSDASGKNPAKNSGSTQVPGQIGMARNFNGSTNYINLGNSSSLNTPIMSISAWIFGASFPTTYNTICSRSVTPVYRLHVDNTAKPGAQIATGATYTATSSGTIATSSWHHCAMVYDGTMLRLYTDGVQTASTAVSGNITQMPSDSTFIGKGFSGQYWNGRIDEVQIAGTSRSPDWVKLCYENQKANQALVEVPPGSVRWIGSASAQWSNPANWSPARIPTNYDTALINAGTAACSLSVSDTVAAVVFGSGYSGTFTFVHNALSVSVMADFRSGGTFAADSTDTLRFIGSQTHSLVPHAVATLPVICQAGSGTTTVMTNSLTAAGIDMKLGTFSLSANGPHSTGFITATGGTLDFVGQTLKVSGHAMLSALSGLTESGGSLEFVRSGGAQYIVPMPGTMHPVIAHTGSGTLYLNGTLRTQAFSQSAGTLDLNGFDIDTVVGNFTLYGGSTVTNLGGRTIEAGGNVTLSGQSGNLLNLSPGAAWTLKAVGTLNASYTALGNSIATGTTGTATNSYDLGGNSNWASITGNPRLEPGPSNLNLGGGYFTGKDSIPLMHLRALTSQAEGAYLDTVRVKMTRGYAGAINYMRLFADLDRNGSFNPPTDTWLKDTAITIADSTVCFIRGAGQHLDSLDVQDTAEYWLVMDLNNATLSSSDTFMFSALPAVSAFRGRSSYLNVNGAGASFAGDTAWGMQGGLSLFAGDSNNVIGKPVLSDQDSIPCMHFSLSATAVEKVFLDTVRVRMVKGNRMAIDKMSLFRDDGANGIYEPTADSMVSEATVAADSVATFWKIGGFDSIAVSQTKRYWLMLHLNSYTISATDTFRFSLNADSMSVRGGSSHAGFPVAGGSLLGDAVPGDEAPYVTEVTSSTASGSYGIGAAISIAVTFSENVTVAGGAPVVTLETGTVDRDATYAGGSGTTTLTFTYTVLSGDASADLDYLSSASFSSGGATIRDANGFDAALTLPTPGTTGSLSDLKDIRIDGLPPTVPSTSVSAPNGGEVWQGGSTQTISWNNASVTDDLLRNNPISLYYSIDGGSTFPNLIAADQYNTGSYNWTVPSIDNSTIRIQLSVTDSAGNSAYDTSDADFIIDNSPPFVAGSALTAPNGGEVWGGGTSHNITWNTGDLSDAMLKVNPISLYYSTDNGTTFPNLIAADLSNTGSYLWTVASENSAQIRVLLRVTDSLGNMSHDTSGNSFTIDNAAPTVASTCLTSPNGGEVWAAGSSQSITWNTGDISDVALRNNPISLYYSTDNGTTYPNLIASDLTNSGSYSWTVASENSGSIRVRIVATDSLGNSMNDGSDASFTIDNVAPSVASTCLTSPNGGEVWAASTSHSITWNTGDISDVMLKNNPISLYYSTDGGSTFPNLIATDLSNSGTYLWTTPSLNASNIQVRITVTDSAGNSSSDASAANFTLDNGPPSITYVTSSKPDGKYGIDSVIPVILHFDENVTVASGTPTLELSTGATVNYTSGSGTQDLVFAYTIGSGESSADLDYTSSTSLLLSSATIRDGAGNDASIALPTPGGAGSLAGNKNIGVDGIAPVISGVGPAAASFVNHAQVSYSLSEAAKSGKVTWNWNGGVSDGGAPHVQALAGSELATGTHANVTLTNAPALVSGAVYDISFDVVDSAGNGASTVTAAGITFDNTAPVPGTLAIADNAGYTSDPQPDLAVAATGADSMAFKLDAGTWSPYEPYSSSKTDFSIAGGGEGLRTVYVRFKDNAGNETDGTLSDQTTYDVTAPSAGSLVIADSDGSTNSATPLLTVSATGADSMHFRLDGGTWSAWEPYATSKSGFDISTGGEGVRNVDVECKDRAGNLSATWSDQTTYDITAPSGASIAIVDAGGYTNDPMPDLTLGATGADSVRFQVLSEGWTSWEAYGSLKSDLSINGSGDGFKGIYAEFKDKAGNSAAAVYDSTMFDATAPLSTVNSLGPRYTASTWPNAIAGSASDALSGVDSVFVALQELYSAQWFNGSAWTSGTPVWLTASGNVSWTYGLSAGSLPDGRYRIDARALDRAGNMEAPVARDTFTMDNTPPSNVSGLAAAALSFDVVALSWTASASGDADSVMVRYATASYPTDTGNGIFWRRLSAASTRDTITGLSEKTRYYIGLFVRDSTGNWSAATTGAQAQAITTDATPPQNVTGLVASGYGGDAVALLWMPSASGDADSVMIRFNVGAYPADAGSGTFWKMVGASVTSDTILGLGLNTLQYVGLFVRDSSGNWSAVSSGAQDTAYISPVALAVTGMSAMNKEYDGTAAASLAGGTLAGVIAGDTVFIASRTGAFIDKNVGAGKFVTVSSVGLSGSDAYKYTVTPPAGITADITAKALSITARDTFKIFGTADPAFGATYDGFVSGDSASNALTGSLAFSRDTGEHAGVYAVAPSGVSAINYAISFVAGTLTINKAAQAITFGPLASKIADDAPFVLNAVASSGLPVTYSSSNTGVVVISGDTVTINGVGTALITAAQPGNADYLAASPVQQTLSVSPAIDTTPPQNVSGLIATGRNGNSIVLSWAASVSADADSVAIKYATGAYPSDTGSGAWWKRVGAAKSADTLTGLAAKTRYFVGLFVRDTAGNWSSASSGAQDTAYIAVLPPGPLSYGSGEITGRVGIAVTPVSCANAGGPIDSFTVTPPLPSGMLFDPLTGTISGTPSATSVTAAYKVRAFNESGSDSVAMTITVLPQPPGPIAYRRSALTGTVGSAIIPDTLVNSGAPADSLTVAPALPLGLGFDGTSGMIIGTPLVAYAATRHIVTAINAGGSATCTLTVAVAYPVPVAAFSATPVSGPAPLTVRVVDSSKGPITSRQWTYGDGGTDTAAMATHVYMRGGRYTITLRVSGPGGNDSLVSTNLINVSDTTPPQPMLALTVIALSCSTAAVSWSSSPDTDVDSIALCGSMSGYPASAAGGEYRRILPAARNADTLKGLPASGATLYCSVFARDNSGNWSRGTSASQVLPDCMPPVNDLKIVMTGAGDTAIIIGMVNDTAQKDVRDCFWALRHGVALTTFDTAQLQKAPYTDTVINVPGIRKAGVWYVTSFVRDAAGNRSAAKIDSVKIANKPPRMVHRAAVTVKEDTLWQALLEAMDWNNDTLRFSRVSAPARATIDSVQGIVAWEPSDADIGSHVFVVRCSDRIPGGEMNDTFMVTVQNVEEPPTIVWNGDSVAYEDSVYHALLRIVDPDPGDTVIYTTLRLPSWMVHEKDTIRGTPRNEQVGSDTIRVTVRDRSGLAASLVAAVRVANANDAPKIRRVERPVRAVEDSVLTLTIVAADDDRGDSLRLIWQRRPAWLSLDATATIADSGVWQFVLTGIPGRFDTGTIPWALRIVDREGGEAAIAESLYVIDRPHTRIAKKQVAFGAVRYELNAGSAADSSVHFEAKLLSLTDSLAIETTVGPRGIVDFFPLCDGRYLFSACAIDGDGIRDAMTLCDTLAISGATVHAFSGDSAQWSMIGVPAAGYPADSVRGSGSLVTWDEAGVERDIYGYYIPSKEITAVAAGRAYWRKSRDARRVTLDRPVVLDSSATMRLSKSKYGWNQVANPFVFPVRWPIGTALWKWSGSDYELCGDILEPWQGYWVMVDSAMVVALDSRPVFGDSGRLSKRAPAWYATPGEWRYRLTLEGRNVADRENSFGISRSASDGYDASDLFEPPRMRGAGYLFFPHPEWKKTSGEFASDIRNSAGEMTIFQVGIAPWEGNDSARMRIEGYDPKSGHCLFIRDASGLHEYDPEKGVTIAPASQTRYVTLFVAADRSLARQMPVSFACDNPYPNPCRAGNRIRYTLPYRWNREGMLLSADYVVTISIYDLAGRRLRDLVHRKQSVGTYTVHWDGKMNTGRMVGAGAYLFVLRAGDIAAKKKITVLR